MHKIELQAYINGVYESQVEDSMKDVYITDHKRKAEQFLTFSEEEDAQFFNYVKSVNSYKVAKPVSRSQAKSKYERGSLAQRIFDPLAGATRNENGTLVYQVEDKEFTRGMDEVRIRAQYERALNQEALEGSEEDAEELRIALMEEIQANDLPIDQWNEMLDKELSVFKGGKRYDFVEDLTDAYQEGLKTPLANKIFSTIPSHVFWDIKKPFNAEEQNFLNPYNPARKVSGENFFDLRVNEQWMHDRALKTNMNTSVSKHRNY